jgi:hypothetical protein
MLDGNEIYVEGDLRSPVLGYIIAICILLGYVILFFIVTLMLERQAIIELAPEEEESPEEMEERIKKRRAEKKRRRREEKRRQRLEEKRKKLEEKRRKNEKPVVQSVGKRPEFVYVPVSTPEEEIYEDEEMNESSDDVVGMSPLIPIVPFPPIVDYHEEEEIEEEVKEDRYVSSPKHTLQGRKPFGLPLGESLKRSELPAVRPVLFKPRNETEAKQQEQRPEMVKKPREMSSSPAADSAKDDLFGGGIKPGQDVMEYLRQFGTKRPDPKPSADQPKPKPHSGRRRSRQPGHLGHSGTGKDLDSSLRGNRSLRSSGSPESARDLNRTIGRRRQQQDSDEDDSVKVVSWEPVGRRDERRQRKRE